MFASGGGLSIDDGKATKKYRLPYMLLCMDQVSVDQHDHISDFVVIFVPRESSTVNNRVKKKASPPNDSLTIDPIDCRLPTTPSEFPIQYLLLASILVVLVGVAPCS